MPIDLRSLKKLDFSAAPAPAAGERMVVLVKLREGAARPAYLAARGEFAGNLFSAEVSAEDMAKLEADPAVESVALSRKLPVIP